MKLHLPLSLRSSLLAVLTLIGAALPVQSASMHSDATFVTYNDFGQNKGRYVNDSRASTLLLYIRNEVDGGIAITYTDGTTPFTISTEQGMPNFSATIDEGQAGLISPNMVVTVCHQIRDGNIWSYSYGGREIGNYKQQYDVVNIGLNNTFSLHQSSGTSGTYDYMLLRQSRIATDTEGYTLTTIDTSDVSSLRNTHLYHTGSGTKYLFDEETSTSTRLSGVYEYISGAILNINNAEVHSGSTNISLHTESTFLTNGGASVSNPLPAAPKGGDSGSPSLIYNAETGKYEYIAAFQSATKNDLYSSYAQARGNIDWTRETIASFDAVIDLSQVSEVHLGRVETAGETKSDSGYSTTLYSGNATDSEGNSLGGYIGLHYEKSTWRSLAETLTWTAGDWYHYDQKNFQSASDADLFYTQNLVFRNPSQAETTIVLDATIDTGIGYSEFAKGELDSASFIIKSATSGNYQLHTSGYVIHEDTEVHLRLVNPSNYVSEWRKIGEGDLYIDGEGDTNALLNVGGKGKTYLNQNGGYAAYNVLANSGATVVLSENNGTAQIEKDFTFGAGGGVLDMNGNSMLWYTSAESQTDDSRFSINALTEEAVITNDSKTISTSTLTYKQGGDSTFLGSFVDTEQGALVIDYQGGGTWTLNSIRTDLTHNEASGLTVTNGTVRLSGTNTVHAMGSATGTNISRYTNPNDWHYADAAMKVNVGSGATFELGSHARLTGDVTVQQGGTYVMREGVTHALEYVEGGQQLEDTSRYAAFYGHKGGVNLNGGTFAVLFNEGADSTLSYSGTVSGTGTMIVNTGRDGGVFEFSGVTDSTIQKVVDGGLLRLSGAAAADTENKWLVNAGGAVVENGGVAETLRLINTGSTGAIALVQNRVEQVDLGNHAGMSIGAFNGMEVQYGQAGTSEQLNTWSLGGGGGELVVNYQLSGSHELVLGASSEAQGTVTLAGSTETYTGKILVQGITLNAGLLENEIVLNNGCLNVQGELSGKFNASNITGNGTLQLSFSDDIANNELALQEGLQADVHLNKGSVQYNAASSFGGNWTLHDGATLRLGDKVDSVSDTLKLAVSGRGELQGSGDYSFASGTISGSGEFVNSISGNVTIADLSNLAHYTHASEGATTIAKASTTVNALSVTAGNVYLETNNDSQRVKGNIVVDGGALHFSSAGTSDMLDYSLPGRSIQVKNGTLDFGTTRQTMGSWNLILGDAALVTGNGDATYGAIDFNANGTIQATEGTSEIAAATRIRNGITLTYDISEDATLNVTGRVFAQGSDKANIIKSGDGTLVFSSTANNYKGTTTIQAGTLKTNNLASLGAVSLAQGSCLELTAYTVSTSLDSISGSGKLSLVFAEKGEKVIEGAFGFDLAIAGAGTVKKTGGQSLNFNVDVNSGATFTFGGDDVIDYGADSRKLTVSGGILDFGTTRQTMGKMDIYLQDGARVTGSGGAYNVNGNHNAALDCDVSDSTIYAARGTSTIEAVTRLRSTTEGGVNLNYDVSKDATLTVSGLIHADDVTGSGSITKLGEGTLVLAGANTYSGTTTVNSGVLRIAEGGSIGNSRLVLNGGTLEIAGSADNIFSDSNKLKVESGLYSAFKAESMTISNALLDVGADSTLELQGGTYTLNGDLGTADSHLVVSSTGLTASGNHRSLSGLVEVKSDVAVTGTNRIDVAQGAELRLCDGASMSRNEDKAAYYIKGTLSTAKDAKNVEFKSIDDIHLSYQNGENKGVIHLAAGSEMNMDVNMLVFYKGARMEVESGAALSLSCNAYGSLSSQVEISNKGEEIAVLNAPDKDANGGSARYCISYGDFTLNNGHLKNKADGNVEVKNRLVNSSIENAGAGLLTISNTANTLTGIHATGGDIAVSGNGTLELGALEIAASKTITAANVVVSELAKLEAGATLAGNLELADSATIELGGTVTLDGVLTLQAGLTLDGAVLDAVQGLEVGESYTLFTGVNGLNVQSLQQAVTLYNMRSLAEQTNDAVSYSALMDGGQVAAADYFSNLTGNSGLVLSYNGTAGTVTITNTQAVPEPTTTTLSLLALAGLCARRRRR